MSEVAIGVGKPEWFSYWLKMFDEEEGLVWEGMVDGRTIRNSEGVVGLTVYNPTLPQGFREAAGKYGKLRTEWEPVWEVVELKQITEEVALQDENNTT